MPVEARDTDPLYAGQAAYTRSLLRVYDAFVYGFNCRFLWRCGKSRFLELYDAHVSAKHLDVGVATGCLLDECRFPVAAPQITLMDLNRNSLEVAAGRIERYAPRIHQANVLEPWGLEPASYGSVAMVNLLHCVPGDFSTKAVAFEHAREALAPGGVLFGASILGKGTNHTRLSRKALAMGNRRGVFCNLDDSLDDLQAGLERTFDSHDVRVVGAIALFSARNAA